MKDWDGMAMAFFILLLSMSITTCDMKNDVRDIAKIMKEQKK